VKGWKKGDWLDLLGLRTYKFFFELLIASKGHTVASSNGPSYVLRSGRSVIKPEFGKKSGRCEMETPLKDAPGGDNGERFGR
jgi:hypothetical protein